MKLTKQDLDKLRSFIKNVLLKGDNKPMSKEMIQATIDANGGEKRMRKLLGMK